MDRIFASSHFDGNPRFTLRLARAHRLGFRHWLPTIPIRNKCVYASNCCDAHYYQRWSNSLCI